MKRDLDRWIWYTSTTSALDKLPNLRIPEEETVTESPATTERNPCLEKDAPIPDFRAPGRRISDVKCYEFIFEMRLRFDRQVRYGLCQSYRLKHGETVYGGAIGGRGALAGEFPHMGAVGWKAVVGTWIFKCGSSLISKNFVLTAAHCTKASDKDTTIADVNPKIVRLGDETIIDVPDRNYISPTDKNIKRIITHPLYKAPIKYFDIALFELDSEVIITRYIQPACLYTGPDNILVGNDASLTGWGVIETVNKSTSPLLQVAAVNVIDSPQCDSLLRPSCNRHWCGVSDSQLCAGNLSGGVDACQGDSGGPLQIRLQLPPRASGVMHQIIGVTSFGIGCALPNLPGIYTREKPLDLRGPSEVTDEDPTTEYPEKSTTIPLSPNPCIALPPNLPDFSAPGRRISETKCFEYIYDIKAREEEEERKAKCKIWQREHEGFAFIGAIGGQDALAGEFPHMAGVGWKAVIGTWIFKCGASLISRNFVLTAAHCTKVSDRDPSVAEVTPKIVRLGDRNIIDIFDNDSGFAPTDVNIKRIIQHPEYNPPKKYFDIALFELENDVVFSMFIQPACLYTGPQNVLVGQNASLTGWGVIETVNRTTSPVLQVAYVTVLDSQQCDNLLRPSCNRHWCGITEHQLCAGVLSGGVDACQGDSGGPLQMRIPLPNNTKGLMYHLIGVTSFGIGCALPNFPGIYTRVYNFIDWIENIVWA
ncbi:hypothetical protein ACJJTC_017081 [Scirpophaga incertulas]